MVTLIQGRHLHGGSYQKLHVLVFVKILAGYTNAALQLKVSDYSVCDDCRHQLAVA